MNHKKTPLLACYSFPSSFGYKCSSRTSSNPQSPLIIDSCKLITKSRNEILNLVGCKHNKNTSLKQSKRQILKEEIIKCKNNDSLGNCSLEQNERLTAMELSENVVYGRGGIGFNRTSFNSSGNEITDSSNRYKQDTVNSNVHYKIKASKRQHESLETIKSLDTAREDASDVEESSAQIVYTQPIEEIWPKKNSFQNTSQVRVRTKPDKDKTKFIIGEMEDISEISKPYVGSKISTKTEKSKKAK